jgi:hypothetical protein
MDPSVFLAQMANVGLQEGSNLISFRRNKKFWQERFDQASYPNQVKLMKQAGLNPALMYKGAGGMPSIGGAPEHQGGNYANMNLAETSAQIQNLEAENALLRKKAITEGFRSKLTALEGEAKKNFVETSKQLYTAEMKLAEQRTLAAEIDNYVKDKSKQNMILMEAQKLKNLKAQYDLTGSQKDLAEARAALTNFEKEFMSATGLKPGGLEGVLGRIVMEIMGIREQGGSKEEAEKQTLEEQIQEAKDKGQYLKAKQLRNVQQWKQNQERVTKGFGRRESYLIGKY